MPLIHKHVLIIYYLPKLIKLAYLAQTCTEAGKDPGCCTGGPQACSVTANGKTCYCDNNCTAYNDCCSDVPKMCGKQT